MWPDKGAKMYLDYSKLAFDAYGRPEVPELELQALSRETLGVLSNVSNLKLTIKFSEPSELSFDLAKEIDGVPTPLYEEVSDYKLIYTKYYGVYVMMNPLTTADGVQQTKQVKGYSIENTLNSKRFFLEEGTFNYWNPGAPDDTIIGRFFRDCLRLVCGLRLPYPNRSVQNI